MFLCDWAYSKRQLLCKHTLFLSVSAVLLQPLSSDNNRLTITITSREKVHAPQTKQSLCTKLSNGF